MDASEIRRALEALTDELAAVEHERWAHWQRYLHSKGVRQSDGSILIPAELVARWDTQLATPFANLTDKEKDSDREQVRKYLPIIEAALQAK